ncbi:MAG: TlpA disulfide reductase family protein [Gemmatimonadota bacterium]
MLKTPALLLGAGALGLALGAACSPQGDGKPRLEANAEWVEPQIEERDGARFVDNTEPQQWLTVVAAEGPIAKTRLLFWSNQAATQDSAGYHFVANEEDHEVLMFDAELAFQGALLPQDSSGDRLQRPVTVAAGPGDRLAAFEASGSVLIFDRWGREFRRIEQPPFSYSIGAWDSRGRLTLARSPFNLAFVPEGEDPPLLATLDPVHPTSISTVGRARPSLSPYYVHPANAGTVTIDSEGNAYYAALGRAEVTKFDRDGTRIWVSTRSVEYETPEPRLVPSRDGPARLALATVQKASAIGPDGLLYVRTAANAEASKDRLDVLDPATGLWLESADVDSGTAILVGERGAAFEVSTAALLEERDRERRPFTSFALQTFQTGDSLSLEDLEGKVKLVSFWASWCGPCRKELPLLDSLNNALARSDFTVIGINEDVQEEDARAFAEGLNLRMTTLLGRGRMRRVYHYSGLPYSVLLDRDGLVIKEYYGFGGREAFDLHVAARVMAALGIEVDEPAALAAEEHDHGRHIHSGGDGEGDGGGEGGDDDDGG